MDDNSDNFLLTQQFFSGQFQEVVDSISELELTDELNFEYYYRSKISLGLYDDVIQELSGSDTLESEFFKYFAQFVQTDGEIDGFEEFINTNNTNELIIKLGSIYLTKIGKIDQAILNIESLQSNNLETLLIMVLLKVYSNNLVKLIDDLKNLKKISNDSIIFNLIESFINMLSGQIQSSFYFFEEIEQQFPNFQNTLQLLCLNLQLLQIPESEELINQLDEAKDLNGDLILNQITLNILNNNESLNPELINQLQLKNPNHIFLIDNIEKNQLFDEIVNKYK